MPTEPEIRKITELHDAGLSLGQIAEEVGCNKSTVSRLLKKLGIECNASQRCATKNATNAKRTYDLARRLELNDKFFKRLDEFVDNPLTARDFKELMVAYGILEDKRQLLEPIKPEGTNGKSAIIAFIEYEREKEKQKA